MPAAERLGWTPAAWEDYQYWQGQDRRQLKRINQLIQACLRDEFVGIGKPEPLRENLSGCWLTPDRRRASAHLPAGGDHACDPGLPLPLPLSASITQGARQPSQNLLPDLLTSKPEGL